MSELSLPELIDLFTSHNVHQLLVKELAENDNSKNQIYLGHNYSSINILPLQSTVTDDNGRLKASLRLYWMDGSGALSHAPHTQLILYPQYPEVRLSGFLIACENPPSVLMTSREAGRLLFLGITLDGSILSYAAGPHSLVAGGYREGHFDQRAGVFYQIPLNALTGEADSRQILVEALRRVHKLGWIPGKRLSHGSFVDCFSPNCGGYTLEAELGIEPNGYSEPDYLGWEVKQHTVSNFDTLRASQPITLMTPEPTGGFYKSEGVENFIRTYGYVDKRGRPDRMNFGGVHIANKPNATTGLTLTLRGYNPSAGSITDIHGGITLVDANGYEAATWHYEGLILHWNRKHAQAAYVPSQSEDKEGRQYRYGHKIRLGTGTDFSKFLQAMDAGRIYYDPGIKLENMSTRPTTKRRSQFRIKPDDLQSLYDRMELINLLQD
jgi:hypothetical protein